MHPVVRPMTEWRVHRKWVRAGRPIPAPPIIKQRVLKQALRDYRLDAVVETGTFTGETVAALAPLVRRLVSIELDERLHRAACERFRGMPHVELLRGDSGVLLPRVLATLDRPALFWLDGHYTGIGARAEVDSPIVAEVAALLDSGQPHVVFIDDARAFTGESGYPTLGGLRRQILERQPGASLEVADDIIRWVMVGAGRG